MCMGKSGTRNMIICKYYYNKIYTKLMLRPKIMLTLLGTKGGKEI